MTSSKRAAAKPGTKTEPKPIKTHVDLSKLRKQSLKRYKKHFNLDVKADSKTELLEAVGRHFATMPVREADVALEFHNYARSIRGKRSLGAESSVDPPAAPAAAGR
eukprot:GFKZ01008793.1.p4 GENE.GFKZ01008793.1~~GFKZ01008793.1.p4  ORF type:complete len:106 (-),score=9.74 GFKZ01008793.1:339-656(-)